MIPKNENSNNNFNELINDGLKDKSKKIELIERLNPLSALRIIPGKINRKSIFGIR